VSTGPAVPRLLAIMGSGETAPTMVKVHRRLLERLGPPPVPAVLLDTPFGFQENAREIAGRAVTYFRESLHAAIAVTGLAPGAVGGNGAGEQAEFANERLVTAVRNSRYVFAGPGSPSYALRKWRETVVPGLLAEKLVHGGCVVFASAAALTLGIATVPVYEIYKCGEDPHWLEGLDVTSVAGIRAAVIPHYDNNEGGTHDTRFCYLGERRLSVMERNLPDGAFVLGVDEHTACIFDLDAGTAIVEGRGVVTVRAAGRSATMPNGEVFPTARILETADALACGSVNRTAGEQAEDLIRDDAPSTNAGGLPSTSPLVDLVREREADFAAAVASRDMALAAGTLLDLERDITEWSTDIPGGDELDRAHASLRSLILELGRLAEAGTRDPREAVGPLVEALLELRNAARRDRRFADADFVRDRLAESGIEVRDTPESSEWLLAGEGTAGTEAGAW
jgi:cyanophycinase-like exopeptidase